MARLPLLGGAYTARSVIANAQKCINLYPEKNQSDSPVPLTHYQRPGFDPIQVGPGTVPLVTVPVPPVAPPLPTKLWVVGSSCELLQFPLAANGNVAPTLDIQGLATQLTSLLANGDDKSFTFAVDFDAGGNQYLVGYKLVAGGTGIQYFYVVFRPGDTGNLAPLHYVHGPTSGLDAIVTEAGNAGIAVDSAANVYLGIFAKIYKFLPGSDGDAPATLFLDNSGIPGYVITSLHWDWQRQWLWTSWYNANINTSGLNAYSLDGVLQRSITDAANLFQPWQVTTGPDGSIITVDIPGASTQAFVYAPKAAGASNPTRVLTPPLPGGNDAPLGVAVDGVGRLYIGSGKGASTVYVYEAGASDALGSVPIQTIAGAATLFDHMLPTSVPPSAVTNIQQLNVR